MRSKRSGAPFSATENCKMQIIDADLQTSPARLTPTWTIMQSRSWSRRWSAYHAGGSASLKVAAGDGHRPDTGIGNTLIARAVGALALPPKRYAAIRRRIVS